MFTFLIPTRNNPSGLSGLLSSLLSQTFRSTKAGTEKLHIILEDGSDIPVITNPHVNRLLTCFQVTYTHHHEPHVNKQRLHGLRSLQEDTWVCLIDDDHILIDDPTRAFPRNGISPHRAFFGQCVDIMNDKDYQDYRYAADHSDTLHVFDISTPTLTSAEAFDPRFANPGFMLTTPRDSVSVLEKLHSMYPTQPAIADDTWAYLLATLSGDTTAYWDPCLRAMHVGNSNGWWGKQSHKHEAVAAAVKAYKNG